MGFGRHKKLRGLLAALLVSAALLPACRQELAADDLADARQAALSLDWALAERYLERYLREEQDGEKRWEAWNLLLKAINGKNPQPVASILCLEAMLEEFDNDEERQAGILREIARNSEALRRYERASEVWSAYVDLGVLDDAQRVEGLRSLAATQIARRQFEAGEETLQQCLALPIPDHDKIGCMLDLADQNMARERWQEVIDMCRQILDSAPSDEARGLAGYLLADALEQQGDSAGAIRQFELYRDLYPNPAVMDRRIEQLRKKTGIRSVSGKEGRTERKK